MCLYCMIGDHHFRFDPPWPNPSNPYYPIHPLVPAPLMPHPTPPWGLDRLKEFEDLLRRVKELEDKLGCPCEPNKADYLALFRERIEKLEAAANRTDSVKG
jgi:hypothetical protein